MLVFSLSCHVMVHVHLHVLEVQMMNPPYKLPLVLMLKDMEVPEQSYILPVGKSNASL